MNSVRLIHWNADEAEERAELLRAAGYRVDCSLPRGPELLRKLQKNLPLAVVIDLSRIPSQGRDLALALRQYKSIRRVPLVFVGGDPDKVERIRQILPDAVYTAWSRMRSSLRQAIAHPPVNPMIPSSSMEGYSGTPLPKKLGIKADSIVALVNAPERFRDTLGDLPAGVQLITKTTGRRDLTLCFVRSRKELQRGIARVAQQVEDRPLWIIWPKKTSSLATDLTQQDVREAGLAEGLVDYKICAVDATSPLSVSSASRCCWLVGLEAIGAVEGDVTDGFGRRGLLDEPSRAELCEDGDQGKMAVGEVLHL
jgi:CheY-like chemotaxis protein